MKAVPNLHQLTIKLARSSLPGEAEFPTTPRAFRTIQDLVDIWTNKQISSGPNS